MASPELNAGAEFRVITQLGGGGRAVFLELGNEISSLLIPLYFTGFEHNYIAKFIVSRDCTISVTRVARSCKESKFFRCKPL